MLVTAALRITGLQQNTIRQSHNLTAQLNTIRQSDNLTAQMNTIRQSDISQLNCNSTSQLKLTAVQRKVMSAAQCIQGMY